MSLIPANDPPGHCNPHAIPPFAGPDHARTLVRWPCPANANNHEKYVKDHYNKVIEASGTIAYQNRAGRFHHPILRAVFTHFPEGCNFHRQQWSHRASLVKLAVDQLELEARTQQELEKHKVAAAKAAEQKRRYKAANGDPNADHSRQSAPELSPAIDYTAK